MTEKTDKEKVEFHEYKVHFRRHRKDRKGRFEGFSFETALDSNEAVETFLDWIREESVADVDEYEILDCERTHGK